MNTASLVALGSGQGSTIEFFCKKIRTDKVPFCIKSIITDKNQCGLIKVAEKFHLPRHTVEYKNKDFQTWDKELCQILSSYKPQLILLAGFLKKIGPTVLNQFPNQIINSHPALIPEFSGPGMYGSKVHQAVVRAKKQETGVTIHIVNKNYDEGLILAQKKIPVEQGESALELEKKIKKIEKDFYFQTICQIITGEISLY